jgi:hypothetical protein
MRDDRTDRTSASRVSRASAVRRRWDLRDTPDHEDLFRRTAVHDARADLECRGRRRRASGRARSLLPQEQEPGKDGPGIFATDVGGIDWADGLVAIMDGPDPDSGTCWEVGYGFAARKPIVLVRTDIRALAGSAGDYNPMLMQAATMRLDLPAASTNQVITAILDALATIAVDSR